MKKNSTAPSFRKNHSAESGTPGRGESQPPRKMLVPMAEMTRYTTQLRSITGGRGYFTMEFDHYDVVPTHIAGTIIEAHKKEMEAKKEE